MTPPATPEEAAPRHLTLALSWRATAEGSLEGTLSALNRSAHAVRLTGKPGLVALASDGAELHVDMVVTAENKTPDHVVLQPGETAHAGVSWGGWDGQPCGGHFAVLLQGGRAVVDASGPKQPTSRGPATNLSSSWFELED